LHRSPPLSIEARTAIVERMSAADNSHDRFAIAIECAREFGGMAKSIATNWSRWTIAKANDDGHQASAARSRTESAAGEQTTA
jgi:hypothetical protein